MSEPLPGSPAEVAALISGVFGEAPFPLGLLQRYRPYLCPFERIIQAVPAGGRVLDAGCGGGLLLALLARAGRLTSGVGFDPSGPAVAAARRMAGHPAIAVPLDFHQSGIEDPWPPGLFDTVTVVDVLHHLPPPVRERPFLAAFAALRPGGTLVVKDIGPSPAWKAAANTLHDLLLARQLVSYTPLNTLDRWAEAAGFRPGAVDSPHRLCYSHEIRVYHKAA